ncbi:MAG: hypothetical protein ABL958_20795 [Bdellovibrionia bacterium]
MTDYHYIEKSKATAIASKAFETKRALDGVLGSECRWLPSDSHFYEGTARTCGSLRAAVFALGRSFEEPDIALEPKHPLVAFDRRLRWIHLPLECVR